MSSRQKSNKKAVPHQREAVLTAAPRSPRPENFLQKLKRVCRIGADAVRRAATCAGRAIKRAGRFCGEKLAHGARVLRAWVARGWEKIQKVKPRYWIIAGAGIALALAVWITVGICCWEWWGLMPKQRPVIGTWSMQQEDGVLYLTMTDDGAAVATTGGKSVKGTYEILEDDRISFDISTPDIDVWTNDYHYWATDEDLTLTALDDADKGSSDAEDTEQTVLLFVKEEKDVTIPDPPRRAEVDTALVGSWSDVEEVFRYEFRRDGTLLIDCQGVYSNCTYSAKNGVLEITTLVDGKPQTERSDYRIEEGVLRFSNMELLKN